VSQSKINNPEIRLTAQVACQTAPINQDGIVVYDADGGEVYSSFGGVSVQGGLTGTLTTFVGLPYGLAPGTYTIGLTVYDAGHLSTAYGTPGGQPMPGGPLTITVTAG
jgi:hypothetical protein